MPAFKNSEENYFLKSYDSYTISMPLYAHRLPSGFISGGTIRVRIFVGKKKQDQKRRVLFKKPGVAPLVNCQCSASGIPGQLA